MTKYLLTFPSPCGVWVVSGMRRVKLKKYQVSVPLRGVGCFPFAAASSISFLVSVPLRGVGCFETGSLHHRPARFPSPCGVWVVSEQWRKTMEITSFRPLAGCGLFPLILLPFAAAMSFRPLAGCGLFRYRLGGVTVSEVSVPWRGVGCFRGEMFAPLGRKVSVPLRGVGCFAGKGADRVGKRVSVPLRGVGCFYSRSAKDWRDYTGFRPLAGCGLFPSGRCLRHGLSGVSVPLRGVGCFDMQMRHWEEIGSFRPLAGCGLFPLLVRWIPREG